MAHLCLTLMYFYAQNEGKTNHQSTTPQLHAMNSNEKSHQLPRRSTHHHFTEMAPKTDTTATPKESKGSLSTASASPIRKGKGKAPQGAAKPIYYSDKADLVRTAEYWKMYCGKSPNQTPSYMARPNFPEDLAALTVRCVNLSIVF